MANKVDKESIVGEILLELSKIGNSRGEILAKVVENWRISSRTFDRLWKIAQERHIETQQAIQTSLNNTILETKTDSLKSALEEAILSDTEIEAILCNIIKGGLKVEEHFKGEAVLRDVSPMEIVNASKTIFHKRGSNAPTKTETNLNIIDPSKANVEFK